MHTRIPSIAALAIAILHSSALAQPPRQNSHVSALYSKIVSNNIVEQGALEIGEVGGQVSWSWWQSNIRSVRAPQSAGHFHSASIER